MKLYEYIIIILLISIFATACIDSEEINISLTYNEFKKEDYTKTITVDKNVTKFKIGEDSRISINKIEGIEKLKYLKKLFIHANVKADLSFLNKMSNIEVLVIFMNHTKIDMSFLQNMTKLKILYINGNTIAKPVIDFEQNKNMVFASLFNLKINPFGKYYELEIKNIPKSLKYLDITLNTDIVYTKRFIDSLSAVPYVFLDNSFDDIYSYYGPISKIDRGYFKDKPNFIFKNPKEVLPEEYWPENIFALFDELD